MPFLTRTFRRFATEAAWLSQEFSASATVRSDASRLACEMVIVRLHDCWARSCRDLIVFSACGNITTLSGTSILPSPLIPGGKGSVIPTLMTTFRKRKVYEPKWFDATECVDAARRLQVQNLATIAAGLGAITSPADTLRAVRNFYAHRGKRTAQQAGKQGVFFKLNVPDVFDLSNPARAGMSHFDMWVMGLTDTLRAASQ